MLNTSAAFKRKLFQNKGNFINSATITLSDNTVLSIDNSHIMGAGFEIEDAVSDDADFTALGATVINSATLVLYNNDEVFSDYDFVNARVILNTGLEVDTVINDEPATVIESVRKGTFTVDDATYGNATITLYLLDYMEQFDRPYSLSTLTYPATLEQIVVDACTVCSVPLAVSSMNFPHKSYSVATRPDDDVTTFREVIGFVATIAGCYARCNNYGYLELKWFDTVSLQDETHDLDGGTFDPWTTGNVVDGGTFNPWTTGTEQDGGTFLEPRAVQNLGPLFTQELAVDDVVITGVRITVESDDEDSSTDTKSYMTGTEGYVIEVSDNPFITESTVSTVLSWLGTLLIGVRFRKCNITQVSDPAIEAGDVAFVWDTKGVKHPILVTRAVFNASSTQTIVCGAQTPSRNSSTRFSAITKSYVESRKQLKKQASEYDQAIEDLQDRIANANGLYETQVTQQDGSKIIYLHNKPNSTPGQFPFPSASDIVIQVSSVGVTVTATGNTANPVWYGLTVDGQLLASVINTISLFFDYAHGGTLKLGGNNNVDGKIEVYNANNSLIFRVNNTGMYAIAGEIGGFTIGSNNIHNGMTSLSDTTHNGVYIGTDGIALGKGAFKVTSAGAGTFSGTITASAGEIGGFTIGTNNIHNGMTSLNDTSHNGVYIGTDGLALGKGAFKITSAGVGTFSGTITASGGEIGGFTIGTNNIHNGMTSLTDTTNNGVWIGTNGIALGAGKFKVTSAGVLTARGKFETWDSYNKGVVIDGGQIALYDSLSSKCGTIVAYKGSSLNGIDFAAGYFDFSQNNSLRFYIGNSVGVQSDFYCTGDISCNGTKSRSVLTEDYGERLLYAYETPAPFFGDIGEGVISEDGNCYIIIESIFAETVSLDQYQVFLQKYGEGDCYVAERKSSYFIVRGTPGLTFGWELKAKQLDYDQRRLDYQKVENEQEIYYDYGQLASDYLEELWEGRLTA